MKLDSDRYGKFRGGVHKADASDLMRRMVFRTDRDVRVLIATDAVGEGVNLQVANLITVTCNEMLYALNQAQKFHLAVVFVASQAIAIQALAAIAKAAHKPQISVQPSWYF